MLQVPHPDVASYDLRLMPLAGVISILASMTVLNILAHVRRTSGYAREIWLWTAAAASGFGIWAAQFVTMLAYSQDTPTGYNLGLMLFSLFVAILMTGVALSVVAGTKRNGGPWIGGAIIGGAICAAHYIAMAGCEVAGHIAWDPVLVAASIAFALVVGAAAIALGARDAGLGERLPSAALLALAICGHDFIGLRATRVIPDAALHVSDFAVPAVWVAVAVALASLTVLVFAGLALSLDIREHHRATMEVERMRGLADASAEGLLVCDGETIVTINATLDELTGLAAANVAGAALGTVLPDESLRRALFERPKERIEGALRLANGDRVPAEFMLRDIDFVGRKHQAIAVRDLRDRKSAEEHIRFLAHHDSLTGLPNRLSFNMKLDLAIRDHESAGGVFAALCLDLDRFKEINDQFGHAMGDAVLKGLAGALTSVLREGQTAARLGGDEFAILAPGLDAEEASRLASSLLDALRGDGVIATRLGSLSASLGIALYPRDGEDAETLMTHADTALYRAKADGRGVYRVFDIAMRAETHDRRTLERDIRMAIARDELRLVYQPQLCVYTDDVVGFEALLRWRHPQRGDVPPDAFIPVAEENGVILPIGEWVLREACREAASWSRPLSIAVNVSAVQLHNADFPKVVHEILFRSGLSPQRLELEITETALIRDIVRALGTLRQLKALGVRIAMDDFGTGYSSLSNLRAFPFDKIKIDKSFVRSIDCNQEAATIVRAVLGLGRGLGLPVLAEGVETQGELTFLNAEACDEAQGWLIGRPADIACFRRYTHSDAGPARFAPDAPPAEPRVVVQKSA